jgi:hypothetical protein
MMYQAVIHHVSKRGKEMKQGIETRRKVPVHKTNPFMLDMRTKNRTKLYRRGNMALINTDTGEIHENRMAGFWEAQEVDASKFVKLYVNGVKALAELTSAGTKVFEILYQKMQETIGKDQVYISFIEIDQSVIPMSRPTFSRGLHELIAKGFLAVAPSPGWFWINPSFIWNGDRLTFVKEYYKKGSVSSMQLQQRLRDDKQQKHQTVLPFNEPEQEDDTYSPELEAQDP